MPDFNPRAVASPLRLFAVASLFFAPLLSTPVLAQETEDAEVATMDKPIGLLTFSSVERLKSDVKYLFDVSGRPDVYEALEGMMENVGDLKGMDQTKPFGAMVFLRSGFPPTPEVVGYFPVENIEDLLKTVELGPVVTRKVDGSDDRYEIIGVNQEFQVRLQNGYAFLGTNAELLDREFPDPSRYTRAMTAKYDIAATLNLDSIPPGMRELFMNVVKASLMSEMQQRDDEPTGQYKIRRANAQGTLEGLTQIMSELERFTIGADADPEKSNVSLELALDAQEDSKLAKEMKDINSKRSYFESLINEESPLTLSVSFPILEKDMERTKEMITGAELELTRELTDGAPDGVLPEALAGMMQALRDTVDDGHMNMFMQFYGEPQQFVIVGGARLVGGENVAAGVRDLLTRLQEDLDVDFGRVELDAVNHKGIAFHHISTREVDEGGRRMFGEKLGVYVGVGPRTAWFAVGGESAMDKIKELMDVLAEPKPANRSRTRRAPFQLVFNMKQWLGLDDDGEGVQFDAFEEGGDRLTVDMQPTDDGMRIRLQMDEGFARLIGMSAARNYDRQQERRARRAERAESGSN